MDNILLNQGPTGMVVRVQETYMGHVCYGAQSSFSDAQRADLSDPRFT